MRGQGGQLSKTCVEDVRHRVSGIRCTCSHILNNTMEFVVVHVAVRKTILTSRGLTVNAAVLQFYFYSNVFLQSRRGQMIRCIPSPLGSDVKENGHDRETSGSAQDFIPGGV